MILNRSRRIPSLRQLKKWVQNFIKFKQSHVTSVSKYKKQVKHPFIKNSHTISFAKQNKQKTNQSTKQSPYLLKRVRQCRNHSCPTNIISLYFLSLWLLTYEGIPVLLVDIEQNTQRQTIHVDHSHFDFQNFVLGSDDRQVFSREDMDFYLRITLFQEDFDYSSFPFCLSLFPFLSPYTYTYKTECTKWYLEKKNFSINKICSKLTTGTGF